MPITKSAKKALRSSQKKKAVNDRKEKKMKDAIKKALRSKDAKTDLSLAYQAIDKAAKRGVIKKNAASRKKSRLMKKIASK